jgi:hypothetical protein
VGKTQRVRMLRQAPGTGTTGEALDWALVYTPALTLTVARMEHTEKGEVVAVFTADLRPADDVGIDTKRCVLGYSFRCGGCRGYETVRTGYSLCRSSTETLSPHNPNQTLSPHKRQYGTGVLRL